jgi:DNA invertase Pin-like site-specific DNA recombinase
VNRIVRRPLWIGVRLAADRRGRPLIMLIPSGPPFERRSTHSRHQGCAAARTVHKPRLLSDNAPTNEPRTWPFMKLTDDQLKTMLEGGQTLRTLAALEGVSYTTIWRRAQRLGVRFGRPGRRRDNQIKTEVLALTTRGWSQVEISRHLSISKYRVYRICREARICGSQATKLRR